MTVSPRSIKKNTTFQLLDSAVAFGLTVIAIILAGLATIIGFNLGEFLPSFWVGLFAPFFIGIAVYVMWWVSHPATKKLPGFILGLADLIIAPTVVILFFVQPGEDFQLDKFGWGLLDAAIAGVLFVLVKLYGWASRSLKSKSNK